MLNFAFLSLTRASGQNDLVRNIAAVGRISHAELLAAARVYGGKLCFYTRASDFVILQNSQKLRKFGGEQCRRYGSRDPHVSPHRGNQQVRQRACRPTHACLGVADAQAVTICYRWPCLPELQRRVDALVGGGGRGDRRSSDHGSGSRFRFTAARLLDSLGAFAAYWKTYRRSG